MQPPNTPNFDLFPTKGPSPTFATYVHKDLALKPWNLAQQHRTIISITGTIDERTFAVINVYGLSKKDKKQFLLGYTPPTNQLKPGISRHSTACGTETSHTI